jgi:hypothetical protein
MIVQLNIPGALLFVVQPLEYDNFPKGASPLMMISGRKHGKKYFKKLLTDYRILCIIE